MVYLRTEPGTVLVWEDVATAAVSYGYGLAALELADIPWEKLSGGE
ncbi:MAG: hypothetical protein HUU29_04145 [Planctomycetaceae bacterium]|nr:hypothetical protein [Planctomycetaceae bacterium]